MKIAVTYANGEIFQHFGHTKEFKLYTAEDGKVVSSTYLYALEGGHGALSALLSKNGADVLICGGIGGGAKAALAECGIKLYGGVSGNADSAVKAFLRGALEFNPNVHCDHHHHEDGHSCGEDKHGCGGNCAH